MNKQTEEWLEATYPEATSRSAAVLMAIRDARTHRELLDRAEIEVDQQPDD